MSWLRHRGGSETFFFPEPMQSGYAEDKASMKFKLLLATLIIAALAGIAAVTVIRSQDNMDVYSVSEAEDEEITTLTWYINYSWFDSEWGENIVSKKITEATGVKIEFIVPKGTESEKLDSMINTDTLPDLITIGWWETQNQDMIEKDLVYALNDLAKQYEPGFFNVADESRMRWYTQDDGNIYGYPNYSFTYEDFQENNMTSHQNFLVRKDIYEAIGSPDMTTPEGFCAAVKKAAEMFPEVDGEPLIPIGSDSFTTNGCTSFDSYLMNFLAVPYEKDGEYYDRYTDPEYIRWLKVFRKLGEEGYLKDEIFIDRRSQLEEKLTKGRYFCLIYQSKDIEEPQKQIYNEAPERVYMAVEGPRNSKGDDPVLPVQGINGWTQTYVSKNCSAPSKAIKLITFLLSEEGQKLAYLGEEGTMYTVKDGTTVINPEVWQLMNTDRKTYEDIYGADDTYWMLQNGVSQLQWPVPALACFGQLREWTKPYTAYTGQYDLSFKDSKKAALYDRMQYLWAETLPKLLLSQSEEEFDKIMDAYVREREAEGYEEFKAAATEQFKMNKEKLGIEE